MKGKKYSYKCPNFGANLNSMRLSNKWCDVTIRVDGKEFRAHKNILAANLRHFEPMLSNGSFKESNGVISMEDITTIDLEALITYTYTGEITVTDSNALGLLKAADYLNEDGIKRTCIEFLEEQLKAEDALKVYKFANDIQCLSLVNIAKSKFQANFENCSLTNEYCNLDFDSLKDLLSVTEMENDEPEQVLFEGMMRWIIHDTRDRKKHLNDLLCLIDIAGLKTDFLITCLGKIADRRDECGIIKDIMLYRTSIESQQRPSRIKRSGQVLMVVGHFFSKLSFQFYNFKERKWTLKEDVLNANGLADTKGTVLNNKLYYISENDLVNNLQVFDPTTKRTSTLYSWRTIFRYCAMCACDRYVYLCGGAQGNNLKLNQVLKYDPEANSFKSLPRMRNKRSDAAAIFFNGCLYVLGGIDENRSSKKVEKYDPSTNEWTTLASMWAERHFHSVTVLNEKLYVCGGDDGIKSVEVYDPLRNSWQLLECMNKSRCNFNVVAYEGKLLAIGGDVDFKMTAEVYDPTKNNWQIDHQMSSGLQIFSFPSSGFISSSCINLPLVYYVPEPTKPSEPSQQSSSKLITYSIFCMTLLIFVIPLFKT